MSASLYEIIELPNGDVVLRRADDDGEPLVSIHFSSESIYYLKDNKFEIAKAMIEAGLAEAGDLSVNSGESGTYGFGEEDDGFGYSHDGGEDDEVSFELEESVRVLH